MRGWSRITHSLRLPAHADASSPAAGASLCLEMRRFGPVANESAEWAVASFWAEDALRMRERDVRECRVTALSPNVLLPPRCSDG